MDASDGTLSANSPIGCSFALVVSNEDVHATIKCPKCKQVHKHHGLEAKLYRDDLEADTTTPVEVRRYLACENCGNIQTKIAELTQG